MKYNFTSKSKRVLELAKDFAMELGHSYIGSEHILFGLCEETDGLASQILKNKQIYSVDIKREVIKNIGKGCAKNKDSEMDFTFRTQNIIESAYILSKKRTNMEIGTQHILLGLLKESTSAASKILECLNVVSR